MGSATPAMLLFRDTRVGGASPKYEGSSRSYGSKSDLTAVDTRDDAPLNLNCLTKSVKQAPVKPFCVTPARQSLARELTPLESALAEALEKIFATGKHAIADIVAELQKHAVLRPSGATGEWSALGLEAELHRINESLDAAYLGRPDGVQSQPASAVTSHRGGVS